MSDDGPACPGYGESVHRSAEDLVTAVCVCACGRQVMSGSGDLKVLRLIRRLRVRVRQAEVTFGSQLATHMALGLLFLGSGRY